MKAAQPLYFGPKAQPLFGWLHGVEPQHQPALGLVICSPFGFEEECAHKSLRHLAIDAAAGGIPTLRFDYATCGNSAGDEFGPGTFQVWLDSVAAAINTLKLHAGVSQVCVAGLRLGATLGALASSQRSDVAGLVAIAPVVQGRVYVRELKVLSMTGFQSSTPEPIEDLLQASGYLLTKETREAVAAVDLRKEQKAPAPKVLIIERDDMNPAPEWAQALQAMGVQVEQASLPGYQAMMSDPQNTMVPEQINAKVVEYVGRLASGMPHQNAADHVAAEIESHCILVGEDQLDVRETALTVPADNGGLFAILSSPEAPLGLTSNAPAIVLISSGTLHNIGPGRMWPMLARQWAARGANVLRVDLPGIGESTALVELGDNRVYSERYLESLEQLLRFMRQRYPNTPCHLVGLCSGATHGFKAAVQGQDWDKYVLINPLTFDYEEANAANSGMTDYEVEGAASKYKRLLFSVEPWKKLVSGQLNLRFILNVLSRYATRALGRAFGKLLESKNSASPLEVELQQVLRNRSNAEFVFCEKAPGEPYLHEHGGQTLTALLERHQMGIARVSDSDHTFTLLNGRNRLVEWLDTVVC